MSKNDYDIIVVGAGPAGSTTAKAAAEYGKSVLMIDKRRELGVPVQCGEALSEKVLGELDIEPDSRWAINKIDKTRLVSPSGESVVMEQKKTDKIGYILDRKVFDKDLAVRAVKEGADISINTFVNGLIKRDGKVKGVTIRSSGENEEIRSDIVIAADGVMSRVARWAGFDTSLGAEDIESGSQFKMVNVDIQDVHTMEFYFGNDIAPGGYIWIFPKGEDIVNVGVGVMPARAGRNSIEYLEDFVSENPKLKGGRIVEINVGGVPISGPLERTYDEGILVVGDAARQVNPLTGGGISYSMWAGDIAGKVAAESVSEGDVSRGRLKEYEDAWRDKIGDDLKKYGKGKEVLLDLSDSELDDLADALQGVNFERISLTEMLKVVMKVNPKLMFKLRNLI